MNNKRLISLTFVIVDKCVFAKMEKKRVSQNLLETWKKKKNSGHFKRTKLKIVKDVLAVREVPLHNRKSDDSVHTIELDTFPSTSNANNSNEFEPVPSASNSINSVEFELVPSASNPITFQNSANHSQVQTQNELDADFRTKFDKDKLSTELVCWAIKHSVNHVQFRALLDIWNENVPLPKLPRDPRTLLNTPRVLNIISDSVHNEKYWFYGLRNSLVNIFTNFNSPPAQISLNTHIDGLPISGSSNEAFWPLLYNIHEMPQLPPNVISIYHGKSKRIFIFFFNNFISSTFFLYRKTQ